MKRTFKTFLFTFLQFETFIIRNHYQQLNFTNISTVQPSQSEIRQHFSNPLIVFRKKTMRMNYKHFEMTVSKTPIHRARHARKCKNISLSIEALLSSTHVLTNRNTATSPTATILPLNVKQWKAENALATSKNCSLQKLFIKRTLHFHSSTKKLGYLLLKN